MCEFQRIPPNKVINGVEVAQLPKRSDADEPSNSIKL